MALAGDQNQIVAQAIAQHLRQSGRLKHYSVVVNYADGTVSLHGQVSSPEQARIALHLAGEAECVDRVINNLRSFRSLWPSRPGQGPPRHDPSVPNPLRKELATHSPEDEGGAARRVPASFTPSVAQRVAATEPVDEAPQPMPMSRTPCAGGSAADSGCDGATDAHRQQRCWGSFAHGEPWHGRRCGPGPI